MSNFYSLAEEIIDLLRDYSKTAYKKDSDDFTHGEYRILDYLNNKENGICPRILCDAIGMTMPRISAAVTSLLKKDLIIRQLDPKDRRKLHIYITPRGKEVIEIRYNKLKDNVVNVLEFLGEKDSKEYARILGIISNMTKTDKGGNK